MQEREGRLCVGNDNHEDVDVFERKKSKRAKVQAARVVKQREHCPKKNASTQKRLRLGRTLTIKPFVHSISSCPMKLIIIQ